MQNLTRFTGLFDVADYVQLVKLISQVVDSPEATVHERLFHEALSTGWNVRQACNAFGVTPHVYDSTMEQFYQQTDAFIFELTVGHMDPHCCEIDLRVLKAVTENLTVRSDEISILMLGDGIGSDSLRFAMLGYKVTYFEFEGYSSVLAKLRFDRAGVGDKINIVHKLEQIPNNCFDAVVCREVLEHVNQPLGVVNNIWTYLRDCGIAVITESFSRIEPAFPTHLLENQKYAGHTIDLFLDAGFRLLRAYPGGRPFVFQKTAKNDRSRWKDRKRERAFTVRKAIKKIGRNALDLIPF